MKSTPSAHCTVPSAYCPLRSPVFLESRSRLLHKSFGLHPFARPKAQTSVSSHFSSNRCVHFHWRSSLLHFFFFLFISATVSPNDHKQPFNWTASSLSLLRRWHHHSTGWIENLYILTKSFFCFLGNPLSLHNSFRSPTATSTSCTLLAITLQLHDFTKKTSQIDKAFNTVHFAATFSSILTVLFLSLAEDHFL